MAADFSKIINHPDKQNIITKITTGESPKNISLHLKSKYDQPDEKHLALSESLLKSFADNYLNVDQRIKKVLKNDIDNKLDRKIADSLLDNKTYKERVAEVATQELDIKRRVHNILHILECRAEQIFDLIQSNPESTKADYIFTKYMEIIGMNLEKADKIINGKPDIKVEHTYTIQMVEQTSNVFQETIRRVLDKMDPTFSSLFMDLLAEEMAKAKGELPQTVIKSSFEDTKSLDKSVAKIEKIDKLLEKEYGQIIEDDGSSDCDITEDFEGADE